MGDITANLSRYEFECSDDCGLSVPHPLLVYGLQFMVDVSGAEGIVVTSGSRCGARNAALVKSHRAGVASQHQVIRAGYSNAADVILRGVTVAGAVYAALQYPYFFHGGLGLYLGETDRVHVDVRGQMARWGSVDGVSTSFGAALIYLEQRSKK